MAVGIMHCLAVKFRAMFRRTLAARWHRPVISLAIVEMMINVSIEVIRPMKPGTRADEHTA